MTKLGDGRILVDSSPEAVNGKCIQGLGSHGCRLRCGKRQEEDLRFTHGYREDSGVERWSVRGALEQERERDIRE